MVVKRRKKKKKKRHFWDWQQPIALPGFPSIDISKLYLEPLDRYYPEHSIFPATHFVQSVVAYIPEAPLPPEAAQPPEEVIFLEPVEDEDLPNLPRYSPERSLSPVHAWDADGTWVGLDEQNMLQGSTRSETAQLQKQEPTLGERLMAEALSRTYNAP
jgi:hypothetical protein